jgi:autotransporter-associated beta strand protein
MMKSPTRIGLTLVLTLALIATLAPPAARADVTLTANAWLNANGQLTNATQGVLATKTSGTGTQADPYVFDVAGNLNLGSYTILGNTANNVNQYSATWRVPGNVTGTGNLDSYTTANNTYGGHVRIEAGGTISLNRVDTRSGNSQSAGSVYLWATGTVTVATSIDTRPGSSGNAGAVTIRSEGPVSGQGITISGSVNGYDGSGYSILAETAANAGNTSAGDVSLYCRTNITLAAGISTRGNGWYFIDGAVLIRGDVTDGTARAATVSIGGTGGIRTDSGKTGGNVTIRATTLQLTGGINTTAYCFGTRTGYVDIDVLENATIGGFIDTRMLSRDFSQGSPGYVKIVARRTALLGVDAEGYSIRTWPGTLNSPGSSASVPGDADVTLTGVDTSAEMYNPAHPTNSMTSSIVVAGKINTGRWLNNNAMGNVRITAVEVQLGGDVTNSVSTTNSVMAIRYGTNAYGVVTHLVENGQRWTGGVHNIAYTLAPGTLSFVGDVPYAGKLNVPVPGTIQNRSVTNVTQTSATFRGYLQDDGDPAAAVSVRWGESAGTPDRTNGWPAGAWTDNTYPATNITTLTANRNYYYAFVAANAGGTNVATPAQYLITGPLTPVTGDGLCGVSATDTATIAISRPGTCVAGPLTVNYSLSGAGTGYVSASPASGFTLAAGQDSTNIVFTPARPNVGTPLGVTLTLLPGAYPSDALASDAISVATAAAPDVTVTNDVYVDAADGGKLKYVSGGGVVALPWPGTTLDGETYAYTYQFNNLDLGGYNVHGALNHGQSQASALFQAGGNVLGGGSFYFYTTFGNLSAGSLRLEAAGSIALSNVWTYVTPNGTAASTYLWAKGGPVTLTGSINNEGASTRVAPVVVRSDGSAGSRGIAVAGGSSGFSIRTQNGGSSSGGKPVWLCTEGDITLGGDVVATASGGGVTIRGNYTNTALRAGNVVVRGSIPTWVTSGLNIGYGSGNIAVLATNLVVDGNLLTYCQSFSQRGGGIRVDVTGDAQIGGYLDTHTIFDGFTVSSPGSVYILARHTAIDGTNATGHSILTKPSQTSGSFAASQPGDGNITLTNVDTTFSLFNPLNPLQGDTSSLSISGKVEAASCGVANIQGDIFLSAVEVHLGDAILTSTNPPSDIAVHYGVTNYNVVTHLVENGTRWNGAAAHQVAYGLATPVFAADVPYQGLWQSELPYVQMQAATGIVETAAWLNATVVSTGASPTTVWVFWGQTSGGTNAGAWGASTNLGICQAALPAMYSFEATNLVAGRTYAYRYFVENLNGGTWGIPEQTFRTFGPPLVDNAGGATDVRGTSATLHGTVTAGRPFPDTYICWGASDGGTGSTGAWQHVEALGALDGAFSRAIGGLTPSQTYVYRCYATNAYSADWADTPTSFTTAAYDESAWTGAGDVNWSFAANWTPSTRAPTQTWDRAWFDAAAPRQPTVDRGLALQMVQVSGTNGWTWSGAAAVTVARALDYGSSGASAWNAALAGAGGVTVTAGQLTLANPTNSFTGETWVRGGRLHASGRMGAGVANVLGAATTPVRVGDTNGAADAILSFANGGVAVTHDRAITIEAGSTGRAMLWSQPAAGGQTLGGALTLGKDTELRTEGSSALTLGTSPSGVGALIKSGAQALLWNRTDSPGHTGGTRVQGGLLQWSYTLDEGADATLQFGGGAGLLTLDGGQFELKATVASGLARLTEANPVQVTTNGGALCAWQNGAFVQSTFTGAIGLGGPLTIGSLTAGSVGPLTYRGAVALDQTSGRMPALLLNHTGSDVVFSGAIADGAGTNGLPLQVGVVAGGATGTPFKLSGTNATYAGGTVFTGGRVTLTHPRAVGPGALTVWSDAICHLARSSGATNWVFAQNVSGDGTIQVEAGANTYQLLSQGATVSPGVVTGAVGTLTIAGRYAFDTNALGQASRLSIDLVATTTNAVDARVDLLRVDHGDAALAASLAQCDLVVNMAMAPGVNALQGSFTILTNTYAKASFTNQAFRSVTVNGGEAAVRYASGYVALDVDIKPRPTGVLLIVR